MSDEDWPPKFTINPRGVAALFLKAKCGACAVDEDVDALVEIFKMFYDKGVEDATIQTNED